MGFHKKNRDAIKRLRKRGMPINGNFEVPETFFWRQRIDPMDPASWEFLGIGDATRYITPDPRRRVYKLDPMLARRAIG
jgi:hypothetical protein